MLPLFLCVFAVSAPTTFFIQSRLKRVVLSAFLGSIIAGITACVWSWLFERSFDVADAILVVAMTSILMFPLLWFVAILAKGFLPSNRFNALADSSHPPLVVAMLYAGSNDAEPEEIRDSLYSQAYGIEMNVDSDWTAEAILLSPPEFFDVVMEETDVAGEESRIVSAGMRDLNFFSDGTSNLSEISDTKDNWLLIGHPETNDSEGAIHAKVQAAMAGGCRVIICVTESSKDQIASRLSGYTHTDTSRLIVALVQKDSHRYAAAAQGRANLCEVLASRGIEGDCRFVVSVPEDLHPIKQKGLLTKAGANGLLLNCTDANGFGHVLDALQTFGE